MKKILLIATILLVGTAVPARTPASEPAPASDKMAWWNEAKFGLFVHWGPYSLYGGVYKGHRQKRSGAEWIMNRCKIPVLEYREMASHFNPVHFDAEVLARTAKEAGMKYLVLTSKHHDGFAMFQSNASAFNIKDWTPFGRDVVDEVAAACRKYGLKFGLYYSQSQDWCNPGGAAGRRLIREGWDSPDSLMIDAYTLRHNGHWDGFQEEKSFDEYIHTVAIPQLKELLDRYGNELAVLFFDTPTRSITSEQAREILDLFKPYPHIIFNDRLRRPDFPGDYKTPEQRLPQPESVKGVYWETCMTLGSSWGYKSWDTKWKSPATIVNTLLKIASLGGNLLLNVGPKPDGTLRSEETDCLAEVGTWMSRYGEVVYGSVRSGIEVPWGMVIRKDGPKTTTLYLCVSEWSSSILLPGIWKVRKATTLQDGSKVKCHSKDGNLVLTLPETAPQVSPAGTPVIVKLELSTLLPAEKLSSNTEKYFSILDEK